MSARESRNFPAASRHRLGPDRRDLEQNCEQREAPDQLLFIAQRISFNFRHSDNPYKFLSSCKEEWAQATRSHPDTSNLHRRLFRAAVLHGCPLQVREHFDNHPLLPTAANGEWESHLIHQLQKIKRDDGRERDAVQTQLNLLKADLDKIHRQMNKERKQRAQQARQAHVMAAEEGGSPLPAQQQFASFPLGYYVLPYQHMALSHPLFPFHNYTNFAPTQLRHNAPPHGRMGRGSRGRGQGSGNGMFRLPGVCNHCHQPGHWKRTCPLLEEAYWAQQTQPPHRAPNEAAAPAGQYPMGDGGQDGMY